MGISLEYGRYDLMKQGYSATSEDIPIKPGHTHVFKIPADKSKGLRNNMAYKGTPGSTSDSIVFRVYSLSFGDGPGFRGNSLSVGTPSLPLLSDLDPAEFV
jgi:hypothetical protein